MHRTTLSLPDELLRRAKIKALRDDVSVSEAVRRLLDRWVGGEIGLDVPRPSRETLIDLARRSRGMWADRDPDQVLAESRAGLTRRDKELARARLGPR